MSRNIFYKNVLTSLFTTQPRGVPRLVPAKGLQRKNRKILKRTNVINFLNDNKDAKRTLNNLFDSGINANEAAQQLRKNNNFLSMITSKEVIPKRTPRDIPKVKPIEQKQEQKQKREEKREQKQEANTVDEIVNARGPNDPIPLISQTGELIPELGRPNDIGSPFEPIQITSNIAVSDVIGVGAPRREIKRSDAKEELKQEQVEIPQRVADPFIVPSRRRRREKKGRRPPLTGITGGSGLSPEAVQQIVDNLPSDLTPNQLALLLQAIKKPNEVKAFEVGPIQKIIQRVIPSLLTGPAAQLAKIALPAVMKFITNRFNPERKEQVVSGLIPSDLFQPTPNQLSNLHQTVLNRLLDLRDSKQLSDIQKTQINQLTNHYQTYRPGETTTKGQTADSKILNNINTALDSGDFNNVIKALRASEAMVKKRKLDTSRELKNINYLDVYQNIRDRPELKNPDDVKQHLKNVIAKYPMDNLNDLQQFSVILSDLQQLAGYKQIIPFVVSDTIREGFETKEDDTKEIKKGVGVGAALGGAAGAATLGGVGGAALGAAAGGALGGAATAAGISNGGVLGGGAAALGAAFFSKMITDPVQDDTLFISQQKNTITQSLKPKTILPATKILEFTQPEYNADVLDFEMFGYVDENDPYGLGGPANNPLERIVQLSDFVASQAGMTYTTTNGQQPTLTQLEENYQMQKAPDLSNIPEMMFNIDKYEVQPKQETLPLNTYDNMTPVILNNKQVQQSMLYGKVP